MARKLEFEFGGEPFTLAITKVDRSKLYGRVKTETYDAHGQECTLATLARDGRTIIPYGGTASGYVNTEGGIYFDPAFLMQGEENALWMLIGQKSDIEFVGFEQAAICAARAEELGEDDSGETDAFDFDML